MGSRTVMIVEDDALLAENLRGHLSDAGFTALPPCLDYRRALQTLRSRTPDFCVLDLDLGGPRGGLARATDEGRKVFWLLQSRRIRTVIHSAHDHGVEGTHASPDLYRVVPKPLPPEAIASALLEMKAVA